MTLPFFILGCGKKKGVAMTRAADLYLGHLFKGALAYARQSASDSRILVLSAKHGLITLDTWVAPYDETIRSDSRALIARVADQIPQLVPPMLWASDITIMAGQPYVDVFRHAWSMKRDMIGDFHEPLEGLGLGQRLHWLKSELEEFAHAA